ncbi:MAG TPA: hypothetical protein VKV27_14555 [Solirubrobacteraceae bacterium]|nr:hypothetical protein [Solirubrobacteraceae bacterium]
MTAAAHAVTAGAPSRGGMFDRSVPVLVLRRSPGPFQHCALMVARTLGRVGVPVYCVSFGPRDPVNRSRYLAGALRLPGRSDDRRWARRLLELPSRFDGAILLAIDDPAAVAVGDHQEALLARFRVPRQPSGIQRRLACKRELWLLCRRLGLPTPASSFPRSEAELLAQAAGHGYPVVIKRAQAWRAPRDPLAPSVAIARDREQLLRAWARMESDEAPQVMLQEYVPSSPGSAWMYNGCFGEGARALFDFTGQKLRQAGSGAGPATLGLARYNDQVARTAHRLMRELGYRGIVDMDFLYDRRDGSYKLLDVNPRLGSSFRLFAAANGLDVVRALHLDLTGRSVPDATCADGRRWIDERGDLAAAARLLVGGALSPREWLRTLRGVDEGAWLAYDDPLPTLLLALQLAPYSARRLAARPRAGRPGRRPAASA